MIILVFLLFNTPSWLHSSSFTSPRSTIKPTRKPRKMAATALRNTGTERSQKSESNGNLRSRVFLSRYFKLVENRPLCAPSLLPGGNAAHTAFGVVATRLVVERRIHWFLWEEEISACKELYSSHSQPHGSQVSSREIESASKLICGCSSMATGRDGTHGIRK